MCRPRLSPKDVPSGVLRSVRKGAGDRVSEGEGSLNSVVFLLGAGASFDAGLPLLQELTEIVRADLPADLQGFFDRLLNAGLHPHERESRSIEDLLTAADAVASARLAGGDVSPRSSAFLAHEVRKRIWYSLSERHIRHIDYLDRLEEIHKALGGLTVASLNNDLVIEKWCESRGVPLRRGFDSEGRFDPRRLKPSTAALTLLKLHGSVDWILRADRGLSLIEHGWRTLWGLRRFQTPIPNVAAVFPSRLKVFQALPLRRLFVEFDERLDLASILVVVGSQLADAHVVEAIQDACRRNETLRVLLVDPEPLSAWKNLGGLAGNLQKEDRIDLLPLGFAAALESGQLYDRILSLKRGRISLGQRLLQATSNWSVGAETGRQDLRQLAVRLGAAPPSINEIRTTASLLAKYLPRGEVGSPLLALWKTLEELFRAAASGPVDLGKVRRVLCKAAGWPAPAHGSYLVNSVGSVYFLGGDQVRLLRRQGDQLTSRPVTQKLGGAMGLAVTDRRFFYFDRLGGRESRFQYLRSMDRKSARSQIRWLRRHDTGEGAATTGWISHLTSFFKQGRFSSRQMKASLLRRGFLDFPTAIRSAGEGLLLVVESRRASVFDLTAERVIATTGDRFLNLGDAAVTEDGKTIYLLENGFQGEGRLLRWQSDEQSKRSLSPLLETLKFASAMALDSENHRLLVSLRENGSLLAIRFDSEGNLNGSPVVVMDGLTRPRWICRDPEEGWLVSTALGVVWVRL